MKATLRVVKPPPLMDRVPLLELIAAYHGAYNAIVNLHASEPWSEGDTSMVAWWFQSFEGPNYIN